MLRPLFFKIRSLHGHLARLAWETVRDLMAAAVELSVGRHGIELELATRGQLDLGLEELLTEFSWQPLISDPSFDLPLGSCVSHCSAPPRTHRCEFPGA